MLNGISQAVSTLGRHITSAASRVSSAGLSGFSVSPQAVRLNPIRAQSPFSPGTSNINARTTFNVSSPATSFTPSRPAPPPPTSGQASGASRPLPPIAQALKDHLAAYEKSKSLDTSSPTYITPDFSFAHSLSVALPLFLVTMASQNAPGIAAMKAAGYSAPVSPLIVFTGLLALVFSPFGVYSVGIAAITAAICQSPEAHPDKDQRWLAAAVAGIFYLIAGLFGSAITGMMAALPVSWIQMLAGLALLSTISGSLYQALHNERERDAAVVAFLVTASGLTLVGIGSAFWGLIAGGVCYVVLNLIADRNRY